MDYLKTVLKVARFEFWRYFKLKDILYGFLFFIISGAIGFFAMRFAMNDDVKSAKIAIIGETNIVFEDNEEFSFILAGPDQRDVIMNQLVHKEIDAVLEIKDKKVADFVIMRLQTWKSHLVTYLTDRQLELDLAANNISKDFFDEITNNFEVNTIYHEASNKKLSKIELIALVILFGLMFIGLLTGNATLFAGITGEKNSRITEQVISIIPSQAWIDGKILGISLMVVTYIGGMMLIGIALLFLGGAAGLLAFLPTEVIRFSSMAQFIILSFLGYMFWFVMFAGIAATINDPNTSSKSSMMMLPMTMFLFTIVAFKNPDSLSTQIISYIPFSSPATFPVRVIMSDIVWWEFPLTVLLLIAGILIARRAAGKVFSIGIMMHGKEPSFAEIFKWLRLS